MSHELIYTSAPRGLKPGSHGFCTVVNTQGIPANLVQRLEALSGYRHVFPPQDAQASLNPVLYSHLVLSLSGRRCHVLSRVCDAGLDHTLRTNKFAHHVVLETNERPASGPATLLAAPGFMQSSWDGAPKVLPVGRRPPAVNAAAAPCHAWQQVAGDPGWGGVLAETAFNGANRPAVVIYRPGIDPLPLLAEAMALLPAENRWNVSFSTYFTKLPPGLDCQWRCMVEGSPETVANQRLPGMLVIDLTQPLGSPPYSVMVEAARTGVAPRVQAAAPRPAGAPGSRSTESGVMRAPSQAAAGPAQQPAAAADESMEYGLGPPPRPDRALDMPFPSRPVQLKPKPKWPFVAGLSATVAILLLGIGAMYMAKTNRPRPDGQANSTGPADTAGSTSSGAGPKANDSASAADLAAAKAKEKAEAKRAADEAAAVNMEKAVGKLVIKAKNAQDDAKSKAAYAADCARDAKEAAEKANPKLAGAKATAAAEAAKEAQAAADEAAAAVDQANQQVMLYPKDPPAEVKKSLDSAKAAAGKAKEFAAQAAQSDQQAKNQVKAAGAARKEKAVADVIRALNGQVLALSESGAAIKLPFPLDANSPVGPGDFDLKIIGDNEVFSVGYQLTVTRVLKENAPEWRYNLTISSLLTPQPIVSFTLCNDKLSGSLLPTTGPVDQQQKLKHIRNCLLVVTVAGTSAPQEEAVISLRTPDKVEAIELKFLELNQPDGKTVTHPVPNNDAIHVKYSLSGSVKVEWEYLKEDAANIRTTTTPPLCFSVKKSHIRPKSELNVILKYDGLKMMDETQARRWSDHKQLKPGSVLKVGRGAIDQHRSGVQSRIEETKHDIVVVRNRLDKEERREKKDHKLIKEIEGSIGDFQQKQKNLEARLVKVDELLKTYDALCKCRVEYTVTTKIAGREVVLMQTTPPAAAGNP